MFEIIKAGGWLMVPILACSIAATGIIIERLWSLRRRRIAPPYLIDQIWQWQCDERLTESQVRGVRESSSLGRVLAAGLLNRNHSREIMKESIEDTGRHIALELERFLNTLGTIAAISPLLGLLGTVIGMIKVFAVINAQGVGSPTMLAGGISEALITTAAGLTVAIPSLMFYRYFRGKVTALVVDMEKQAIQLVEVIHGDRELHSVEDEAA